MLGAAWEPMMVKSGRRERSRPSSTGTADRSGAACAAAASQSLKQSLRVERLKDLRVERLEDLLKQELHSRSNRPSRIAPFHERKIFLNGVSGAGQAVAEAAPVLAGLPCHW